MIQLERILVPTDFSEASNHSLPHAMGIAQRFKAEVVIAHIHIPFSGDADLGEHHFVEEGKYEAYAENELQLRSGEAGSDLSVVTVTKRSISAASGILESISEIGADMVVMGTHGRSGLAHFFLGSVAEKVVRHSTVPVLTVAPAQPGYREDPDYQKILVAFDFSKHSKGAVLGAKQMADRYQARLQVLYVIEQEVHPGYYETWKETVSQDIPRIEAEARKSITDTVGESEVRGIEISVVIGSGNGRAHDEITRFANEQETDLVVMGTHGLSGFEHMLLGSTTERVVRSAPCPVLTFHLRNDPHRSSQAATDSPSSP